MVGAMVKAKAEAEAKARGERLGREKVFFTKQLSEKPLFDFISFLTLLYFGILLVVV